MGRPARPWDLFNAKIGRVPEVVEKQRYDICQECDLFRGMTKTCRECGCFMPAKVLLPNAFCPVHKWSTWEIK